MSFIFRDPLTSGPRKGPDATHLRQLVSAGLALLTAVVVSTPPFKQTEWPLAKKVAIGAPDPATPRAIFAGPTPFAFYDWTLAKRTALSARDFLPPNVAAINTVVVVGPQPFAFYDWALARRIPLATPAPGVNLTALLPPGPVPPPVTSPVIGGGFRHIDRKTWREIEEEAEEAYTTATPEVLPEKPTLSRKMRKRIAAELKAVKNGDDEEEEAVIALLFDP